VSQRFAEGAARLGRLWLLAVVVVVAVQLPVIRWAESAAWARWLDELSLVGLAAIAAIVRLRERDRGVCGERWLALALALFVSSCAISALVRHTGLAAFALGTFDYVKNLVFLWCAATLADDALRRRLVLVVRTLAFAAVLWALLEVALGWLFSETLNPLRYRFGIYRPDGPMGHPNLLGLFLLLAILVEMTVGSRRTSLVALFYLGMASTLSRIVHAAATVVLAPLVRRAPALALAVVGSALIVVATASLTEDELAGATDSAPQGTSEQAASGAEASYRAFAIAHGLRVWRDHPWLGVGAGRFGGVVSAQLDSDVYERYPIPPRWRPLFDELHSLDIFYPQLLAELGIVGTTSFAALAAVLLVVVLRRWRSAVGEDREWAGAAALALCVVPIYCLGAGLNLSAFLVPTMIGAGVSLATRRSDAEARIG